MSLIRNAKRRVLKECGKEFDFIKDLDDKDTYVKCHLGICDNLTKDQVRLFLYYVSKMIAECPQYSRDIKCLDILLANEGKIPEVK